MAITYGFFATGSGDRDRNILSKLERSICRASTKLFERGGSHLAAALPARRATDAITGITRDGVRIAIVGRPLIGEGAGLDVTQLEWSKLAALLRKLDGYWLAFAYDTKANYLEVECDHLGVAWLYWAWVPGGVAFSSDFGALARCLPAAPRLNDDACLLSLTLTYPVDDSTCFHEIRVVSPRAALR
jgi:hypothetical protein